MAKDSQPVELSGSNVQENPNGTAVGQTVVSVVEDFETNLALIGRPIWISEKKALVTTDGTTINYLTGFGAKKGYKLYPRLVSVSVDVDCEVVCRIILGIKGNNGTYNGTTDWTIRHFAKAREPFDFSIPKEVYVCNGGSVYIGAINNAAANVTSNLFGYEVTRND